MLNSSAVNDLINRASNLHSCTSNDWISCTWTPTAERWFSRTEACSLPHLWFYCFTTSLLSLPRCLEKLLTFQQLLTSWNSKKDAEHLSFWIRGSQKFCSWAFGNANSVSIFGSSAVSKSDCHPPFPVLRATWRSAGAQENSAGRALLGGLGQRHVLAVSHLVTGETLGSFGRCAWYRYIPWTLDVSRMVTWVPRFNKKRTLQQTERTERTQKRHRGPCSWRFLICNNPCSMVSQAISIHFILPKRQLPHATAPGLHDSMRMKRVLRSLANGPQFLDSHVWQQAPVHHFESFGVTSNSDDLRKYGDLRFSPFGNTSLLGFFLCTRMPELHDWKLGDVPWAEFCALNWWDVASCCCQHQSFQQSRQKIAACSEPGKLLKKSCEVHCL